VAVIEAFCRKGARLGRGLLLQGGQLLAQPLDALQPALPPQFLLLSLAHDLGGAAPGELAQLADQFVNPETLDADCHTSLRMQ
jgi:hypothetical protein